MPKQQPGKVTINEAVVRANCAAGEVVELLYEGQLEWVSISDAERHHAGILVDLDEVKSRVRLLPVSGMHSAQFARTFGLKLSAVKSMIVSGKLPTHTVVNPVNRCPMLAIDEEAIELFKSDS